MKGLFLETLGNAVSDAAKLRLKKPGTKVALKTDAGALGALIGTAVAPGPGTAVGFVLGVLIKATLGFAIERNSGKSAEDEAATERSARGG